MRRMRIRRAILWAGMIGAIVLSLAFARGAGAADEPDAKTLQIDLGNGVSLEAVYVPPGKFTQGSPDSETGRGDDETQREVTLTQGFYIGKTAVTRGQWERFAADRRFKTEAERGQSGGFGWDGSKLAQDKKFTWKNPGFEQSPDDPVCIVTYNDARSCCAWLSRKSGRHVDLPTEAQWEYACRAGTTTPWHNGATEASGADEIAWSKQNAGNRTHPVTSKKPNAWGIYIGGNVAEWCRDFYGPYAAPDVDPLRTTGGQGEKLRRVLRGGSWNRDAKNTRSAARFRSDAGSRNADVGFRVVLAVNPDREQGSAAANPPPPSPQAPPPAQSNEVSPGEAFPQVPTAPAQTSPPVQVTYRQSSSSARWNIFGLLCLAAGLAIVVFIAYLVLRAVAKTGSQAQGFPAKPMQTATPVRPPAGSRPAGAGAGVRLGEDGFWLLLDVAAGSRVHYGYRVASSVEEAGGSVLYQPGAEGQFVYTGAAPQFAHVTHVDPPGMQDPGAMGMAAGMGSTMFDAGMTPPPLPTTRGWTHRTSSPTPTPTPFRPSAY